MTTTTTKPTFEGFSPDYSVAPGATVADLLDELQMTQTDLARRLGVSLKHLNQVINGSASISADLALGLEKVFDLPADFWLSRDAAHRAHIARTEERVDLRSAVRWAEKFPIAELKKREFLPVDLEGAELVASLLRFLGIASPEQWHDPTVAFRKSQKTESDRYALAAWLRVGELEARDIECEAFSADRFRDALDQVRRLTREDVSVWQTKVVEVCANAGVAVVIVDAFNTARANGATRWISPTKAIVQLSLRYKWEDIFWFSFFHEAGHVLLHRKKELFVETSGSRESEDPALRALEDEADRFASRTLIPTNFERALYALSISDIPEFAERVGVAPAIVVGRLQHEKRIRFSQGNQLRRRLKFV